jgi:hypothetical protein
MIDYAVNIQNVYRRADDTDMREGMAWYGEAHTIALEAGDVWRGAGVLACFSPRKRWKFNVIDARRAWESGTAFGHNPRLHTDNMCGLAQRILDGEHPLDVLKGDKTRSFAEAIATAGEGRIATVDCHAHDIAMGRVCREEERDLGKRNYRAIALAYAEVAEYNAVSVNRVQAVTWVRWKRERGDTS